MVTKYGMSPLGPIMFGSSDSNEIFLGRDFGHTRNYSEDLASKIDEEINHFILSSYKETEKKLNEHMDKLHAVAQYLYQHEKMDSEQFKKVMQGEGLPPLPDMPDTNA